MGTSRAVPSRRALESALGALLVLLLLAGSGAVAVSDHAGSHASAGPAPEASVAEPVPEVGALFAPDADDHTCTGTVLHSASGDLVLTAAHCLDGTGEGMQFVPALSPDGEPYGRWDVTAAYVDDAWQEDADPADDVAILRVAPDDATSDTTDDGGTLESHVGGYPLGDRVPEGAPVTVTSYNTGDDDPVTCTVRTLVFSPSSNGRFATFACDGFVDGSSGSPWVTDPGSGPQVVGIIGGLLQGGCTATISYSPHLDAARDLLAAVEAGAEPVSINAPPDSGC